MSSWTRNIFKKCFFPRSTWEALCIAELKLFYPYLLSALPKLNNQSLVNWVAGRLVNLHPTLHLQRGFNFKVMLMQCTEAFLPPYFTPHTKLKTALNPVLAIQINLGAAGARGGSCKINSSENCFLWSDCEPPWISGAGTELLLYWAANV